MRQYEREDVNYETWYSPWMRMLAKNNTLAELEAKLNGNRYQHKKESAAHLRAIESRVRGSMQTAAMRTAKAMNVSGARGEERLAIDGAIEIYALFPEHTKEGANE